MKKANYYRFIFSLTLMIILSGCLLIDNEVKKNSYELVIEIKNDNYEENKYIEVIEAQINDLILVPNSTNIIELEESSTPYRLIWKIVPIENNSDIKKQKGDIENYGTDVYITKDGNRDKFLKIIGRDIY